MQVTGLEEGSKLIQAMVASFKSLKDFADFTADPNVPLDRDNGNEGEQQDFGSNKGNIGTERGNNIRLGYTIHLNLPATTDIAVFNAIFKSLREHLL